jgi:hypothetical protein
VSVASPLSTGGAGTVYEYRVAAVVLAKLLRGDRVIGLDVPVTEVRLQQRIAGSYLDDVIAVASHPGAPRLQVDIQVKRTVDPVPSDKEWKSVVSECLSALAADPDGIRNREHLMAVAARANAGHLEELAELTRWARQHDDLASFNTVISAPEGGPNAKVSKRWDHLCTTSTNVLTETREPEKAPPPADDEVREAAFRIAHALHVWVVEAEADERDHRDALDRLGDLTPPDQPEAAGTLFLRLADIAQARGPRAGGITVAALRAELERKGVLLPADRRHHAGLAELSRWTDDFLSATRATMADALHLPRTDLLGQISAAAGEHEQVLVTGRAGAGKSVLARLAARDLRAGGATVVAFSLTERAWKTLADVEGELHARLETALPAAATTGSRLLLIDGAEQMLTDNGTLLRSLLRVVPRAPDAPSWQLVVTARDEAASAVAAVMSEARPGSEPNQVSVGDLTDAEVEEVLTAFRQLEPLNRHRRPRRLLLRRPYLVDLLVRGSRGSGLPERMLAEEDVVSLVYERLVRRADGVLPGQGEPNARSDIYFEMASVIAAGNASSRLPGTDASARTGLVSDNVLDRDVGSFRFSHDVLADYAVATLLGDANDGLTAGSLVQPRRMLRSVRLWMQRCLADAAGWQPGADLPATWAALSNAASGLAASDGPRWLDVPCEALLNAGPAAEALRQLAGLLAADDGAGLTRLIDVTRRHARPQPPEGSTPDTEMDVVLSDPVVELLAGLGGQLPAGAQAAATRLVCAHLRSLPAPPGASLDEPLARAAELPAALMCWAQASQLDQQEPDTAEALAILAAYLDADGEQFLLASADEEPDSIGCALEEPLAVAALARFRPQLLLRLASLYFLHADPDAEPASAPDPRVARRGYGPAEEDEVVTPHASRRARSGTIDDLAHPERGPFAALLGADSQRGLRLVGMIVDVATQARVSTEARWGQRELTLELKLPHWPRPRAYRGTPAVWGWHRRLGVGAFPAMSALMALRAWADGRLRAGDPVSEVADDVLQAGTSLAFAAVAAAVLSDHIDAVTDELDTFLASPLVWQLESARASGERTGPAIRDERSSRSWWTMSNTAMHLVLQSSPERREALRLVGEELASRSGELVGAETPPLAGLVPQPPGDDPNEIARLQATRWATELDISHYQAEPAGDDRVKISVEYPGEVTEKLTETRGRRAAAMVEMGNLLYRAMRCRDGQENHNPADLHTDLTRLQRELDAAGRQAGGRTEQDAVAAVAAALLLGTHHGADVSDAAVAWAAGELLEVSRQPAGESPDWCDRPGQQFEQGADRSAAVAVPVLLSDAALRERVGTDLAAVSVAVLALAGSRFAEVRARLTAALLPLLRKECADPDAHHAAVEALKEMVASAGYGPWVPNGRPRVRLLGPLPQAIASDDIRLDTQLAAPAVPGLDAAASVDCAHGQESGVLLAAVTAYDLTRWPAEYARRNFIDTVQWRDNLDQVTAQRALDRDPALLGEYLAAFMPAPEELRGILTAMTTLAVTPERTAGLHQAWPQIMDALLPAARQPRSPGERKARDLNVEMLDEALLPLPPEGAPWPTEQTADLVVRWVASYTDTPHLAPHLIRVLIRFGWLATPQATSVVLIVLGTRIQAIRRRSGLVVGWLRFVLKDRPEAAGSYKSQIQAILDGLAADGVESALRLQHEMEA